MQEISNHVAASYKFILVIVQIVTLIAQFCSYTKRNWSSTECLLCEIQMQNEQRHSWVTLWVTNFPGLLFLIIILFCDNIFNYFFDIIVINGNSVLYVHVFAYLLLRESVFPTTIHPSHLFLFQDFAFSHTLLMILLFCRVKNETFISKIKLLIVADTCAYAKLWCDGKM